MDVERPPRTTSTLVGQIFINNYDDCSEDLTVRVICPFTSIETEVRHALDATGWAWEAHDVSGSTTAYSDLLAELWRQGESFALVEQDIVVNPNSLSDLAYCDRGWCAFTYPFGNGGSIEGLGCTKFSAELIALCPDAIKYTWEHVDPRHPAGHWCTLDIRLNMVLSNKYGVSRHVHMPMVGHLRPMPSHRLCGTGEAY